MPRPMSLRVFLARTRDGWQVMPGGFARIGRSRRSAGTRHAAGRLGCRCLGRRARARSPPTRCCRRRRRPFARSQPGVLPSRAADNLFWLGRYVERAEDTMRLTARLSLRLAETADPDTPLLDRPCRLSRPASAPIRRTGIPDGARRRARLGVRHAPAQVRDRFSVDGWLALTDLDKTVRTMSGTVAPGDDMAPRHGRAVAQDLRLFRPGARKHVPLHRLALPVDRPVAGARRVDGRAARPLRRSGRAGRRARPRRRGRRQRR